MNTARRFVPLVAGLGLLVALSGCGAVGGSKADVAGTIKLRGQAPKMSGLQIVFAAPDGTKVAAIINDDGSYKAQGVPTGEVGVSFVSVTRDAAQEGATFKQGGGRLKKPTGAAEPPPKVEGNYPKINPIPEALRDAGTSKLTVKVESGKTNTFDYDITP